MVTVMHEPGDVCPVELLASQEHQALTGKPQCAECDGGWGARRHAGQDGAGLGDKEPA